MRVPLAEIAMEGAMNIRAAMPRFLEALSIGLAGSLPPCGRPAKAASPSPPKVRLLTCIALMLARPLFAVAANAEDMAAPAPIRIAVFDFELEDRSAGAGIIPPDEHDIRYLAEATEEAKRRLTESGRFAVVGTTGADLAATKQFGLRNCGGCEAAIAKELGAEQAMLGVVGRVSRTEYTMLIRILETAGGTVVSSDFTDLRMGANYSWPRGVKWLMSNRVLADKGKK
jgi:hypothetical protein